MAFFGLQFGMFENFIAFLASRLPLLRLRAVGRVGQIICANKNAPGSKTARIFPPTTGRTNPGKCPT